MVDAEDESCGTGGMSNSQYSGWPSEEIRITLECRPADIVVLLQCFFICAISIVDSRVRGVGKAALRISCGATEASGSSRGCGRFVRKDLEVAGGGTGGMLLSG